MSCSDAKSPSLAVRWGRNFGCGFNVTPQTSGARALVFAAVFSRSITRFDGFAPTAPKITRFFTGTLLYPMQPGVR
jgi:hypothetical protein